MTLPTLAFLLSLNLSTAFAGSCVCVLAGNTLTITDCSAISSSSCRRQKTTNNVIIDTGVTSIGNNAFSNATSLNSITIPDSVTRIGNSAFLNTSLLSSITIPDSVTSIGWSAFQGATLLSSIMIPDSVTRIDTGAFSGARSLTSITIPDSVTSIGVEAFYNATGLTSITIPDGVNTANWDANVFRNLPENTDIVCQGDLNTCYEKLAKYIPKDKGGTCTKYCIYNEIQPAQSSEQCNGSYIYENGNCHKRNEEQCNATDKYYYNGATCLYRPRNRQIVCVNPNYKANDGYCDRLRYTPAEAAKVLKDDNTNSVTITFKK